jgi:hypothetical protein
VQMTGRQTAQPKEQRMADHWGQTKEPNWVRHWASSLVQWLVHPWALTKVCCWGQRSDFATAWQMETLTGCSMERCWELRMEELSVLQKEPLMGDCLGYRTEWHWVCCLAVLSVLSWVGLWGSH